MVELAVSIYVSSLVAARALYSNDNLQFLQEEPKYQHKLFKLSFIQNLQDNMVSGKVSFLNSPVC